MQFPHANPSMFGPPERAIKHDFRDGKWNKREVTVSVALQPFQEGTNRTCFLLKDFSQPPAEQDCVAKVAKNPQEERNTYFAEVEMQGKCESLAMEYNKRNPPKRVNFIMPFVIEFPHRMAADGLPMLMGGESRLKGAYTKFSNNFGFVTDEEHQTPQAFSHFSHEFSNGTLLVCDIQGTEEMFGDLYTDPQIHSNAGNGVFLYGNGDIGADGIREFFATHKCNSICKALGLKPHNPHTIAGPGIYRKDQNGNMLATNHSNDCSRESSIGSHCSSNSSGNAFFGHPMRIAMHRPMLQPILPCIAHPAMTFMPLPPLFQPAVHIQIHI